MAPSTAPGPAIISSGLQLPIKVSLTEQRNLLVSENGPAQGDPGIKVKDRHVSHQGQTGGPSNPGRLTRIGKTGQKLVVLSGLPKSVTSTLPSGKIITIVIGAWDLVIPGPVPGSEVPNPNPSSPILASILVMHLPVSCDDLEEGFSITLDNHAALLEGHTLSLTNSRGERATLRLLAKFRNYTPAPTPQVPNAVRGANPFGIVKEKDFFYLADAAQNSVVRVHSNTGAIKEVLTFPQMQNPGGTPSTMDAVPDSIRLYQDSLLIPLLSGYPFPAGVSEIRAVGLNGTNAPFIKGLTSAIDIIPVRSSNGTIVFYVLEYSLDQNNNAPGRLLRYDSPSGPPTIIADQLPSPTNMAYDESEHSLYITEIFAGNLVVLNVS